MEPSVKMEGSSSPSPDWRVTVQALIWGARDSAILLSSLLQDHVPRSPAKLLLEKIVSSIYVLDDCVKTPVLRASNKSPPFSDYRQNVVSRDKKNNIPARRAYKSRSHPYACPIITTKTINDAYSWRKYGQKDINSSTFPRCYYRCTHKTDRGCQATRQLQQSEEDPTMFVITYMGEHTCRSDPNKASTSQSCFISFGSGTREPMISAPLPLPKLDSDEDVVRSASPLDSSLSEELGLPEIMAIEASEPSPTPSLLSQISFDWSHDFSEMDLMRNDEFINLDELLDF